MRFSAARRGEEQTQSGRTTPTDYNGENPSPEPPPCPPPAASSSPPPGPSPPGTSLLSDAVGQERNPAARSPTGRPSIKITKTAGHLGRPRGVRQDRDQPRRHRLGRDQGRRSARGEAAGRVAVRAARRREPDAHRAPLAEDLPRPPRHPRRAVHGPHARRHRHGPVGHRRQAVERARLPPARRADAATASASTTRRRPTRSRPAASTSTAGTPADIDRIVARDQGRPASRSARTARSCSTPTAPCRRRR